MNFKHAIWPLRICLQTAAIGDPGSDLVMELGI